VPGAAAGGAGLTIVLCHGFGAPGDDLVPLADYLGAPVGTRFLFPEAPIDLGFGRAWWEIDMRELELAVRGGRDRSEEVPVGLEEARAALVALLEAERVPTERLVLGGFSQGAMLATDVALRLPAPPAGLVVLSGTLLGRTENARLAPARRGLPVLQSHGRQDPLLPFRGAEALRDLLAGAGLDVTFVPFDGGHEIPLEVLRAAGPWLARLAP
jgi:phospholipase/carboxylesterase